MVKVFFLSGMPWMIALFFSSSLLYGESFRFMRGTPYKLGEEITARVEFLGLEVAELKLKLEDITNVSGYRVFHSSGSYTILPGVDVFYKVNDSHDSYFDVNSYLSIYHCENFNQSGLKDRTGFFYDITNRTLTNFSFITNRPNFITNYSNTLRNIPAMLYCVRMLDFDYYITNGMTVQVDYIYFKRIWTMKTRFYYTNIIVRSREERMIAAEEMGGNRMLIILKDDPQRTPFQLIVNIHPIPIGDFRIYGYMLSYKEGTGQIPPVKIKKR